MSEEKLTKIVRITLITVVVLFFVIISYQNYNFRGVLTGENNFSSKSMFMSEPYPKGRITGPNFNDNERPYITILNEPIYFDLRLPRPYQTLELEVEYEKPEDVILQIGPMVNKDKWLFELIRTTENSAIFNASYEMGKMDKDKGMYKIMFSSPGLSAENEELGIKIFDIKVKMTKDPITLENFWTRFKGYIERIF